MDEDTKSEADKLVETLERQVYEKDCRIAELENTVRHMAKNSEVGHALAWTVGKIRQSLGE